MPTFDVTIAATVPVYATIKVEAATLREATEIAQRIARQGWKAPELPDPHDFEPERDAMDEFTAYSVLPAVDEPAAEPA